MTKVAVLIGRFQTPELTYSHKHLIDEIVSKDKYSKLLILIGVNDSNGTNKNPLNYRIRKQMIRRNYPYATIRPIHDTPNDTDWSVNVDQIIQDTFPNQPATIFGGRDNNIEKYYTGLFEVEIIRIKKGLCSATATREYIAKNPINSYDFRAGIIYQCLNKFPTVYSTVDVAILQLDGSEMKVLMGQKQNTKGLNFIGGFVDPQDDDLEAAALRELGEEVGNNNCRLAYQFSAKVKSIRYDGTADSIMTHFFINLRPDTKFNVNFQNITDPEFSTFSLVPVNSESVKYIEESHQPLFNKLILKLKEFGAI